MISNQSVVQTDVTNKVGYCLPAQVEESVAANNGGVTSESRPVVEDTQSLVRDKGAVVECPITAAQLDQKVRQILDEAKLKLSKNLSLEPFDVVQEASEESFPASDSPAY